MERSYYWKLIPANSHPLPMKEKISPILKNNESTMSPNSTIFKGQLLTTVSFLAKQITLVGPGSV